MESNIKNNKMRDNNILINNLNISVVENYNDGEEDEGFISTKIMKLKEKFVNTTQFFEAVRILTLEKSNPIILVGRSGIGKTDTSYMIANHLKEHEQYKIRVISPSNNDYERDFKALAEKNNEIKEVLIFDDFLGSTKLIESTKYFVNLERFLKDIEYYSNIKIIFNSRNTILQDIKVQNVSIKKIIDHKCTLIDLEKWGNNQEEILKNKFAMFKKYCVISDIFIKITDELKKNDSVKILQMLLEHINFTPLIILRSSEECKAEAPLDYLSVFIKNLNNPEDIWYKEYQALDEYSQRYLKVLYSLSDNFVKQKEVDKCYENYMKRNGFCLKYSVEEIQERIEYLVNSDNKYLNFVHPSLKEYICKRITRADKDELVSGAIYFEQIERIDNEKINDFLILKDDNTLPDIFKLEVLPFHYDGIYMGDITNSKVMEYLKNVYKYKIQDKKSEPIVIAVMQEVLKYGPSLFFHRPYDLLNVLYLNYDFNVIFENEEFVRVMYDYASEENLWRLLELTVEKDSRGINFVDLTDLVQEKVISALCDVGNNTLEIWIEENAEKYIEEIVEFYGYDEFDTEDIACQVFDDLVGDYDNELSKDSINDVLKKIELYNIDIDQFNDFYPNDYVNDFIEKKVVEHLDSL
ncbi:MAG: hypothetical protein ACE3K2_28790 [Paenibacillus sp.]|uniref:nSTAND3 domain-containing NTPase n=1 Tax=Paenibacillus sp. TaxID=58172 RepID=UPI003B765F03